jgi:hypothetical protein
MLSSPVRTWNFGYDQRKSIMIHLGNLIVIDEKEPMLLELRSQDLVDLLELRPSERLGHIIELNRSAHYHNRLDAFALLDRLTEISTPQDPGKLG